MEGSSTEDEEKEVATFCPYHPCYFFEAVRDLFKCLGFEFGTNGDSKRKEKKNSMEKAPSDSEEDPITPENIESNNHSQEVLPTCGEQAADQEYSPTTHCFHALVTSILMVGRRPRRPELTPGPGPQTN